MTKSDLGGTHPVEQAVNVRCNCSRPSLFETKPLLLHELMQLSRHWGADRAGEEIGVGRGETSIVFFSPTPSV